MAPPLQARWSQLFSMLAVCAELVALKAGRLCDMAVKAMAAHPGSDSQLWELGEGKCVFNVL